MSVRENLAFGLENTAMARAEIDRRVGDAARLLQIEALLERKPKALSGGQRQRVAIGRAITRDPRIFLFDEPLSNLDAGLRVQMRVELSALHARLGATMIYVTHDQVEAMTMASRIVVLRLGRVEQVGAPLDLYNRPANQFVAEFIGSPRINLLDGRLAPAGDRIRVAVPGLADCPADVAGGGAATDEPVTLGIRPEHVVVGQGGLRATVELAEQLGSESYVHCLLPTGARLVARLPGQASLRRGEAVALDLPARHCHVFRHAEGRPALARLVT
jgi:ABC-type sugar transport system ATPase subunit